MKLIKTRLRNRIGQSSLSYLMKIGVETPEKLTDTVLLAYGIENLEQLLYE